MALGDRPRGRKPVLERQSRQPRPTPGSATNGASTNWGVNEPNSSGEEDCLQMYGSNGVASAQWNDVACASATSRYVIEVTG